MGAEFDTARPTTRHGSAHLLRIEPLGRVVAVPSTLSLLQAAQQGGVWLPRSCQNGTCRACFCRIRLGHVEYSIEWPGLSAEEKRDGYVLPCVAYAVTDITLEVPSARLL